MSKKQILAVASTTDVTRDLRDLVDELTKDAPDAKKVKILSLRTGVAYSGDSLTMMTSVLDRLNQFSTHSARLRRRDQESTI